MTKRAAPTVELHVRLDAATARRVKAQAKRDSRSWTSLVRLYVERGLAEDETAAMRKAHPLSGSFDD